MVVNKIPEKESITINQPKYISKIGCSYPINEGTVVKCAQNKIMVIKIGLRASIKYLYGSILCSDFSGTGRNSVLKKKQITKKKGTQINSHIDISVLSL